MKLRIHLSVYLLQQLLNATDRGMEQTLRDNTAYQVFCGKTVVKRWHCPDHTKIEPFRSRLSPETQCALDNAIMQQGVNYGFADTAHLDIDSTVQEADIQYPAAPNLLVKMAVIARHIQKLLGEKLPEVVCGKLPAINLKVIKGLARAHYLIQRGKSEKHREAKQATLNNYGKPSVKKSNPCCHSPLIWRSLLCSPV